MKRAVLGLDTSCYATSCALLSLEGKILADVRLKLEVKAGERGLRQSEAVFQHIRKLPEALTTAFGEAPEASLAAVCASAKPVEAPDSYMPVFQAGLSMARALAASHQVPCFETTHQAGHLAAARIGVSEIPEEHMAIHLSGGTTEILHVTAEGARSLGKTRDISAGQLLDRVGVRLGYSFPAGRRMDELARGHRPAQRYPAAVSGTTVSFSGAEAAVLRDIEAGEYSEGQIASELFDLIARSLLRMTEAAAAESGARQVLVTGGVAASETLRENLANRMSKRLPWIKTDFSLPARAGDNAVGVAFIGLERLKAWKETHHGSDSQRQGNLGEINQ